MIVARELMTLVAPFAPWNEKHWSTGAYLINRRGAAAVVKRHVSAARGLAGEGGAEPAR